MDHPPSAMSHSVRTVGAEISFSLFNRTTRSVALTQAGLFARLRPVLMSSIPYLTSMIVFAMAPMGTLKINTSRLAFSFCCRS
ncbi:hypothetical protein AB6846_24995 [Serratia proteamaculans]